MQQHQRCVDEYHAAMKRERELWEQVKGRIPGTSGFNRELWDQWLAAVGRTTSASKALREAFSRDSKLGARP